MDYAVVPTLSDVGWVTDPPKKADALLGYFFQTSASQSYLYSDSVTSAQAILAKNANNIPAITSELEDALQKLLSKYFDSVTCNVSSDAADQDGSLVTVYVDCTFTENGTKYSLGRCVENVNSKFSKISAFLNTGKS